MSAFPHQTDARAGAALDRLVAPVPLAALALLVVNDHVLKANYPGWLSGKLSDVAVLVLIPFLLVAAADLFAMAVSGLAPPGRRALVASVLGAAALFTAIELVPVVGDAYRWTLGAAQWVPRALASAIATEPLPIIRLVQLTHDPSDLLTLPFAAVILVRLRASDRPRSPLDLAARAGGQGPS